MAQYGSCTFMAKRFQGNNKLELSWCQKGKWDHRWMEHWFYVKMTGQTITYDDGTEETVYPLAFVMSEMSPLSRVTPPSKATPKRQACDRAFALAWRYSGGQDLVEETVAANFWPLGRRNDHFHIEMVQVPMYGPAEGIPFPCFERALLAEQDHGAYVAEVEEAARGVAGAMSDRENLARKSESGAMP
jgi:hypothetical protein